LGKNYEEFCNLYEPRGGIMIDNKCYPTAEHYFQARKFDNHPHIQQQIILASSGKDAFNIAKNNGHLIPNNWHSIKEDIMKHALTCKFQQYQYLKQLLKDTGNSKIVEHTKNDKEWGDGGDGTGSNKLGNLLMKLRDAI